MVNVRRLLRLLVLDGAVLVGIVVVTANELPAILAAVRGSGLSDNVARIIVVTLAAAMAVPFCLGVLRVGRRLGVALARLALPAHTGARVDFALAPRRALVVTLQLASVMLVGGPLVALTQPFLPGIPAAAVLGAALVILGLAFWRSATNLQDHVLAGAQVILQALNVEGRGEGRRERGAVEQQSLERVHTMLPGLGALLAVRLDDASGAIGKTLAQLNLRGVTGATVLAITRAGGGVIIPSGMELLSRGDVLALAGTHEAVEAGRRLLAEPFHDSRTPA
jgi:CPA2 family monovalent cation:H+ antiporter-2